MPSLRKLIIVDVILFAGVIAAAFLTQGSTVVYIMSAIWGLIWLAMASVYALATGFSRDFKVETVLGMISISGSVLLSCGAMACVSLAVVRLP